MAFKCPVSGCEDAEKEFKTETALISHIRNKHPERAGEASPGEKQVPIVEEEFATLLMKFKIPAGLAANIAENVSHTGGAKVFEDPELLLKRLAAWTSDITPVKRNNIIAQWFAERSIDISPDVQRRAGMTTDQIQKDEKATKEDTEVRYVYDTEARQVRMAKEGEKGGTLPQAKELKEMAEEDKRTNVESPFMQDEAGNWVLNPKARVTGVELMAVQFMQKSRETGEPMDPIVAMTKAAETWKTLREGLGVGASTSPAWMTDPVTFLSTIQKIAGGNKEDSGTKEALAAMQKTLNDLKEERWREQFTGQQKQIQELSSALTKALDAVSDLQKGTVGRTEMDILHEIAASGVNLAKTELPGLRRDIKEALGSVSLPGAKTPEQREERKQKFKEAIDTDREIEELGRRLFFNEG